MHASAHGFVRGRSILTNAQPHAGAAAVLKLDIEDFFPTIGLRRVLATFLRMGYPPNVAYYLSVICCFEGRLPQGSAASPMLSNVICKRLDARIEGFCQSKNLKYTRYADDITVSGDCINPDVIGYFRSTLKSEGFSLNDKKTQLLGPRRKKIVTGVSISSGIPKIPKSYRRKIQQDSHHLITKGYFSHTEHIGDRDPIYIERLIGRVGYWLMIEPGNPRALLVMQRLREFQQSFEASI